MKCPRCGLSVPQGTLVCPHCGAFVATAKESPSHEGTWCPTCGAHVPFGAERCPNCSMPVPAASLDPEDMPQIEDDDEASQVTRLLPRMQSALTAEGVASQAEARKPIANRSLLLAVVAVVLLLGGGLFFLAHPWNPDLYDTKATSPADRSLEGFPGARDKLVAQDSTGDQVVEISGDQATYESLSQDLNELDGYADDVNEEFIAMRQSLDASPEEREELVAEAQNTALGLSNLITSLQGVDVTSGVYVESKDSLIKMANYLRNRSDAICSAWDQAAELTDVTSEKLRIVSEAQKTEREFTSLYEELRSRFELPQPAS